MAIFHQNIRGLQSKIDSLEVILDEIKPQIIVVTEHNLVSSDFEKLSISGFKVCNFYARTTTSGGGVAILCGGGVKCRPLTVPHLSELYDDKLFECCLAIVKHGKHEFVLVGIYRSPSTGDKVFIDTLYHLCNDLINKYSYVIVAGDININILDNSSSKKHLCNMLNTLGLKYYVDFPTRVTDETETGIDNFLSNINFCKINAEGLITVLSDHDGQVLRLSTDGPCNGNNSKTTYKRLFTEENKLTFKKYLKKENWVNVYNATVEQKYDEFSKIFMYYFNMSFPRAQTKSTNKKAPWIDANLHTERIKVSELYQMARLNKDKAIYREAKRQQQHFIKLVNEAKKKYYENKISNSDNVSKVTWNIINTELNNRKTNDDKQITIKHNGITYKDPEEISKLFNKHFIEVTGNIKNNDSMNNTPDNNEIEINKFRLDPVGETELNKLIDSLKNKYSSGFDEIPVNIFKYISKSINKVIIHLINSSFISGIFPQKLKTAKLVPVYKKGDDKEMSNYRPLSLLPTISKMYEKAMYNRLITYLDSNNLIDHSQHGFRKGKSTKTATVQFVESIVDAIDRGEKCVGVFMDLKRAFDTVCHKTLLDILKSLGIIGKPYEWLSSYITDRMQFVEITNITNKRQIKVNSNMQYIKNGIPQGSILGPLLFIIYINQLSSKIMNKKSCEMTLYADDSNIKISGKSLEEVEYLAKHELVNIYEFLKQQNLSLSIEKTNFISFDAKTNKIKNNVSIMLNENSIKEIQETKFLGLTIDKNLNWNSHVDQVIKKMSSGVFALKRMAKFCSLATLKVLYHGLIQTHLSYNICIYGATSKGNLDRLLIIQKKCIRAMLSLRYDDSVRLYFKTLRIFTVYCLYIYDAIMYVKEIQTHLTLNVCTHKYSTRNCLAVKLQRHRLEFFTKKTTYAGIKFLRQIPESINKEQSLKAFKSKLKQYLLDNPCYSIDDFLTIR